MKSLYTCIPNDEGIKAVREAMNKSNYQTALTKVITSFLFLILTLNNFIFNCKHYIQNQGVSMGTICAPSYANIFLGSFESKYIYPSIRGKCNLYTRFIDDIFLIWKGTEKELLETVAKLNETHHSIKFEVNYSYSEINFLDCIIYKDKDGKLQTKVYRKPTDRPNYLHSYSEHPASTKSSIIYSQALRIKRICSEETEFKNACENLKERLMKRGYREETIVSMIEKAALMDRNDLLEHKEKTENTSKIPFVTTYNKTLPNIKPTLEKHWDKLEINERIKSKFTEKPIIAYRRNKSVRDIICSNNVVNNKIEKRITTTGMCRPCRSRKNNLCCQRVKETNSSTSNVTKRSYKIREHTNCKSEWIIYLLGCKKCRIQYTGKSEWPMNIRINKHRFDVTSADGLPACQHFNLPDHKFERDSEFIIIEKLQNTNGTKEDIRNRLKQRENFWIRELRTLKPWGLNMELNRI